MNIDNIVVGETYLYDDRREKFHFTVLATDLNTSQGAVWGYIPDHLEDVDFQNNGFTREYHTVEAKHLNGMGHSIEIYLNEDEQKIVHQALWSMKRYDLSERLDLAIKEAKKQGVA
jgi:hypothetical protein